PPGGDGLRSLERIDPPPRPLDARVTALHDVDHPLLGPRGAAAVFGPQKGAGPVEVDLLERGLERLADRITRDLGLDVSNLVGAGAAGGLGAGAVAFLGGSLEPGIDRIIDVTPFERLLGGADWVMTGEGRLDATSFGGKVVGAVAARAAAATVRLAVLAGDLALSPADVRERGVEWVAGLIGPAVPVAEARQDAARYLREAARSFARERLV
ncbi:MAG: glycerate kinase, partial [Gemmatimonadetes bacterium]|nr:glycerate kinase [Gemmatimonadota bacterium]